MWTTTFFKSFFKNILFYMNSWLSKIRSVYTYVMPLTVYFGLICILVIPRLYKHTYNMHTVAFTFPKQHFVFNRSQGKSLRIKALFCKLFQVGRRYWILHKHTIVRYTFKRRIGAKNVFLSFGVPYCPPHSNTDVNN